MNIKTQITETAEYRSTLVKVGKTEWAVMVVTGKTNYVSVRKVTSNPFGALGKQFENADAAIANYKSAKMQAMLIQVFDMLQK
jgi:hypothetical protein